MHNHFDLIHNIYNFNEQIIGTPDGPITDLTLKQHDWTQRFCVEELDELRTAFNKVSFTERVIHSVDAVGDLIYGAMGTFKKMGLTRMQVAACFKAIHLANMTKKRGDKGRGSDEDAVKPIDFVPPETVIHNILFAWSEHEIAQYLEQA